MSQPKAVVLNHTTYIVPRELMLFCLCDHCHNELNWRHTDATYELCSQCCEYAFRARPLSPKVDYYRVEKRKADLTNVARWLYRKSSPNGSQSSDRKDPK